MSEPVLGQFENWTYLFANMARQRGKMVLRRTRIMLMTKHRTNPKRDFTQIAASVVERAIGERLDGTPLTDGDAGKDPRAVQRGRAGGLKGGTARAKTLSAPRRKAIAKKAAKSRWNA